MRRAYHWYVFTRNATVRNDKKLHNSALTRYLLLVRWSTGGPLWLSDASPRNFVIMVRDNRKRSVPLFAALPLFGNDSLPTAPFVPCVGTALQAATVWVLLRSYWLVPNPMISRPMPLPVPLDQWFGSHAVEKYHFPVELQKSSAETNLRTLQLLLWIEDRHEILLIQPPT